MGRDDVLALLTAHQTEIDRFGVKSLLRQDHTLHRRLARDQVFADEMRFEGILTGEAGC